MERLKTAIFAGVLGVLVVGVLVASPLFFVAESAHATVAIYNVAQADESDFSHWYGDIRSRGINSPKLQLGTVKFDNSYPTGGETLDLSGTFKNKVLICIIAPQEDLSFEYVHATASAAATGKVKAYTAAGSEVSNTTDLQAVVTEFIAVGW